ncbi:MAG: ATP synthase F1 subunit epsilon [Planctomycetia bacterium TMED53]|nr:MAG: ATP synthase F1 subunit epsilon [Planctomycetia bacterium TMED53]
MASMIHCQLLSPEGAVFDGQVSFVGAHALDGRVGILPNHAPLITALGEGPLVLRTEADGDRKWTVRGGFMEVLDNHVSILAEGLQES